MGRIKRLTWTKRKYSNLFSIQANFMNVVEPEGYDQKEQKWNDKKKPN